MIDIMMTDIIVNLKATNFVQFETNLKIVFFLLIVSWKQNKYFSMNSQSKQSIQQTSAYQLTNQGSNKNGAKL